jgi:hypothetical protein
MRVFIAWSQEPSRSIAKALHDWLQGLFSALNRGCPTTVSTAVPDGTTQ